MKEQEDRRPILLEDLGIIHLTENSKHKARFGLYKCGYCGKEFKARTAHMLSGKQKSCRCRCKPHGLSGHPFYTTWRNMNRRCNNKNDKSYKNYGGRGISVCEEWLDVKNFVKWAEATHPNIESYTLDRINNDKGYNPDNCTWSDKTTQVMNRGKSRNNKSGYVGINWDNNTNKWIAQICVSSYTTRLGYFKTLEEAIQARDNYIIENNLPHKLSTEY